MTPTPETPSLSELKRLRESAFYLISPVHFTDFDDTGFSETQKNFIAYAANHSVSIAESLQATIDELKSACAPDCGCDGVTEDETGWACFHCEFICCSRCAPSHFGVSESFTACQEKMESLERENAELSEMLTKERDRVCLVNCMYGTTRPKIHREPCNEITALLAKHTKEGR